MDGHRSFFDNSGILLYRKLNLHFNVGKIQCYIKNSLLRFLFTLQSN